MRTIEPIATVYSVCWLPMTTGDYFDFAITVELTSHTGTWAIRRHGMCLGRNGFWTWELRPSSREDNWLTEHRFDLQTALRLAADAAPGVMVNGVSAVEASNRITKES